MKYLKSQAGFTLIEVIISLAILGLILVLFMSVVGTTMKINKNTLQKTYDSMMTIDQVEREQGNGIGTDELKIIFKINEGDIEKNITGSYIDKSEGDVLYKIFIPN